MNVLVTGGSGFIGSHFIEGLLKRNDVTNVYNLDANTYAANKNLPFESDNRYRKLTLDICAAYFPSQKNYLKSLNLDYVIHFAAESHVDNSITGPKKFIDTNIVGTFNLLEIFNDTNIKKFIHVSTDEVFGSLNHKESAFTIDSPYKPNSPYASSKAASDLIVRSFNKTYGFPTVITNCSNNFGPRQHKEKMIPKCISSLKAETPIPLYGDGSNIRDWIFVKDHASALMEILFDGKPGKQYLIGGDNEISNFDLIHILAEEYKNITNKELPPEWFKFVEDRKGHDLRYAIDNSDFKLDFPNWKASDFKQSIKETISSCLQT
jgi:dTDP-glucose 4,6-dehydratase